MKLSELSESFLRCISAEDRARLKLKTREEVMSHGEVVAERKLHAQIRNLLNLKGIEYLESRMDKRTTFKVGWPDFTFAVLLDKPNKMDPTNVTCVPIPIVWEIKVGNAKLRPEQQEMFWKLQKKPNGWRCVVIRSLQQACDELRSLGI